MDFWMKHRKRLITVNLVGWFAVFVLLRNTFTNEPLSETVLYSIVLAVIATALVFGTADKLAEKAVERERGKQQ